MTYLPGATSYQMPPLEVPRDGEDLSPAELLDGYDAIALFVARAQEAVPSFALNPENAPDVAKITHGQYRDEQS